MKFSDGQLKVINTRKKNILVSAAAGSGKTTVLVERIIKLLIDDNEDIDKFLIVTFTNAAASGMKQKIHKALIKAVQNSSNKGHLSKQLNLLGRSNISTIHAFCIDTVRKNFHVIGIDPNFRIGDVNEIDILLNETIDEILEKHYTEKTPGFVQLVESFTGNRGDFELNEIIKDIYRFILSFPDPMKWLDEKINMLLISSDDLKKSPWTKAIKDNIMLQLSGAKEILETAIKLCDDDGPTPYKETLMDDMQNIQNLEETLKNDFEKFLYLIHNVKNLSLKQIRGKAKEEIDGEKQEEVKLLRDEYKKIINGINKMIPNRTLSEFAADVNYMHVSMSALFDIICDLDKSFKAKKMDKSIADFNDVEHYALEILRQEDIGESYRSRFKYIFIDEYQDSNSLQEELLSKIKRENNLFMVGDVKQSIYRFRLSDPAIFNEKCETYPLSEGSGQDIRIDLTQNFRSRKEILSGINYVFSNIMNKTLGEVDYNRDVFLNPGSDFTDNRSDERDCFMDLTIIDKDASESDDLDEEIKSMKTAELEAYMAVQKINQLLKKNMNEPIRATNAYNKAGVEVKKIQYKDIVLLMRSVSGWAGIFEEIFNDNGIPFYFDGGSGYYETIEIQVILNLLKIIDNIRQDVPVLSVMRSPIGSFEADELVHIRLKNPKLNFIDALYEYKNNCYDELALKIENFIGKIENWKKRSRYSQLSDFIWEVLMETNYYYFVGMLPNGRIRQANLRMLTEKASDFEKTSMSGLFNFLRYVEKLNNSSSDTGSAKTLGENDNVVRLMSVHKSKGLEFPVVIICGLNKKFNRTDSSKSILKHKLYGIAPKYINPQQRIYRETLPRIAVKNIIKTENISEEMRVLYVAMTRAIDRLIMIGTVDKFDRRLKKWSKGPSLYNIYNGDSFLEWICTTLFKNLDAYNTLSSVSSENVIFETFVSEGVSPAKWNINKITLSQINRNECEAAEKKAVRINEMDLFKCHDYSNEKTEINRRLSCEYSYSSSINVPTKLSVTDLKVLKRENIETVKFNIPALRDIPQFKEKDSDFTQAEIGSIVHFVMQHLNICDNLGIENIKEQIDVMIQKKLLTEQEANVIDVSKIFGFFRTDVGRRMRASLQVKREVPFVIKKKASEIIEYLDGDDMILIQGIIDCYFYEGDKIVIIDYKTDEIIGGNTDAVIDEYSRQILSYKEAVEKITGVEVKECYLYLFDIEQAVEIR